MTEPGTVDITLPADQDVLVPDYGDPVGTATALLAAAAATGAPAWVVRVAADHDGFYAPASVVDVMIPPGTPVKTPAFIWAAMSEYLIVTVTPDYTLFPGYDTYEVSDWGGPGVEGFAGPLSWIYDAYSTYNVSLRVTDSTAALPPQGPFTETVSVRPVPAGGWVVSTGEGLTAMFQPHIQGNPDNYTFTWGDGSPTSPPVGGYIIKHTYPAAGTYTAVMHVVGKPDVPGPVTVYDDAGGAVVPVLLDVEKNEKD